MELNQLLQTLLSQSGLSTRSGSEKVLAQLTQATDSKQTQTLLQMLRPLVSQAPSKNLATQPASQLPALIVSAKLVPPAQPQQSPQLRLQPANQQLPPVQIPLAKAQLPTIKALLSQLTASVNRSNERSATTVPSPQLVAVIKPTPSPVARHTATSSNSLASTAPTQARLEIQLVNINQTPTRQEAPSRSEATVSLPVAQLPKPVARALLSQLTTTPATAIQQPATNQQSMAQPTVLPQRPLALKQAQQISPQQFRQALQQLVTPAPRQLTPTPPTTPAATPTTTPVASPQQAVTRVLQAVVQQLPQAESMQQPQALKQWVNDWFAAKPVSQAPAQQMGGLGKMLMMLLSFTLQPAKAAPSQTTAPANSQPALNQLTQALLDQVLRPAPRVGNEPVFNGEVRERINQLLQQLPQTQLQRLMQLFTGAVNNAQTSQARLAESPANQPEYFILLPTSQQQPEQTQLLIRRDTEAGSDDKQGRTVWLFTLRFELKQHGPLLVKGRYHPAGTRIDFYTESASAEQALQARMGELEQRFSELEVNGLNLRVQQGKVPSTLAQQQSGIIRVTV